MGTRVSLNAIVFVPTIVGHYSSPILNFTNLQQASKLDNGPAACVPFIPQEQASQISSPKRCIQDGRGGEGERGEQSNYNDDGSGGYVGGNGNDNNGNSDDGNSNDGNAVAKKTTTTYGDGNGVYDGDGRRWRWRR